MIRLTASGADPGTPRNAEVLDRLYPVDGVKHPEKDRFDVGLSGEGIEEVKVIDTFHGDESLKFEDALGEIIDSFLNP